MDGYTWLDEWGSELLSPWAYFQRFEFANAMKHRALFQLLQIKWLPPTIYASDKANLVTLPAIDERKVFDIFHVSLHEQTASFLQRYFGRRSNVSMYYPKSILHTCPICIVHGFHSQLHQIKGIDHCAFHDIPLQSYCPACGRSHRYMFTDSGFQSPFVCVCGYHYMEGLESGIWPLKLWKSHHAWTIRNNRILIMESMTQLYRIRPTNLRSIESQDVDERTIIMVRETYKSFLRLLRRQLNRRGEKKIVSLICENLSLFSSHAYAYIKLKMFAEHLDSYTLVDAEKRSLLSDLHQGLLSNTSAFLRLYRATMTHFQSEYQLPTVQRILSTGIIAILTKRYESYLQEGRDLLLKSHDERTRALKRREYKRTYKRKPRDINGNLIQDMPSKSKLSKESPNDSGIHVIYSGGVKSAGT